MQMEQIYIFLHIHHNDNRHDDEYSMNETMTMMKSGLPKNKAKFQFIHYTFYFSIRTSVLIETSFSLSLPSRESKSESNSK